MKDGKLIRDIGSNTPTTIGIHRNTESNPLPLWKTWAVLKLIYIESPHV